MKKCTGIKQNGSQCPSSGSCSLYYTTSASVIQQAPFTMINGIFNCSDYLLMTEHNLEQNDYDNNNLLGS